MIPSKLLYEMVTEDVICIPLSDRYWNSVLYTLEITHRQESNPKTEPKAQFGQIGKGNYPGQQWQIDFSDLPRKGGFRYLLVLMGTFSGWPKVFPCQTNKSRKVTKILLQEIIPRSEVPAVISSDQRSYFIAKTVSKVSKLLGIDWQLHTLYNPQSSGQVEKMSHLIKIQIV